MNRKVVAYIRVSTEEQARHGYSMEAQRQVLADYARGHNLEIVKEFEESESAYKPGRPEFEGMLKYLKLHRSQVCGVLCYKIDRIARNLKDYSELAEMEGITIISATEALPDNSTGRLIGTVQAAFSRYYSDQLSERISLGLATKARKGEWPTHPPSGYVRDSLTGAMIPDREMAVTVRQLFEEYARRDISLAELTRWGCEKGLRSNGGGILNKSAVHKLLKNPIYHGALAWRGHLYDGIHEPIVSRALFERVQERLRSGSSPRSKRSFPYRGLLECGYCGCKITASLAKGTYIYYHCSHGHGRCSQPYIRQDRLSEMLGGVIDGIHLTEEQVRVLVDMMHREKARRAEKRKTEISALKEGEGRIQSRRDAAYVDKLDGRITDDRWGELDRTWSRQLDRYKAEREGLERLKESSADEARATFELLERAPILYLKRNDEERARLLRTVVSNCLIRGKNIDPIYKKPFDAVAVGVTTGEWWRRADSNRHPPACKAGALPFELRPQNRAKCNCTVLFLAVNRTLFPRRSGQAVRPQRRLLQEKRPLSGPLVTGFAGS